jgi:hypothetical protein
MAAVPTAPSPLSVLLCTMELGEPLELDPQHPLTTIKAHVGEGGVDRIRHLDGIDFWVGGTSAHTSPINDGATALFTALLCAAAAGDFSVSDRERAHAHRLLGTPENTPIVHGPCVVTGADLEGNPTGLPGAFWAWFTATLAADRAQAAVDRVAEILADLGIDADVTGFGPI